MQRLLRLEDDFTVVYWDQRGTGLSSPPLRTGPDEFPISVPRMVDDTVSMLELLRRRFGRKPFVAGFSFGATFAAYAAARRPELVAALVATGMDIDVPAAEEHAYAFALDAARRHGHRRAIRQLEAIGPPPHTDAGSVPHAGPLGGELRRRHRRRHLQRHRPHAAREPAPLTRLLGRRGAPCPSGHHGLAGRAAA